MRRIAETTAAVVGRRCGVGLDVPHERHALYDREGHTRTVAAPAISGGTRRRPGGSVFIEAAGLERAHRELRDPTALRHAPIDGDDLEEQTADQEARDRSGEAARAMVATPVHGIEPMPTSAR